MKFIFPLLLVSVNVFAASGGHHAEGIPTVVYWQAANIAVLFISLFFLLRKQVVEFFAQRKAGFLSDSAKSKQVQEEAEKSLSDIKHKLDLLVSTAGESIERARAQANDLKRSMIKEAEETANRVQKEAQDNMRSEIEKAKLRLRAQVVQEAVSGARGVLQKDIGQADHKNLQEQFAGSLKGAQL